MWRSCIHIPRICSPRFYSTAASSSPIRVAVVGSGPAGFYLATPLLREHPRVAVDFFEKLPVPFGLVRFGVAPDHPEVKNCIHQFETLVEKNPERVNFYGNVTVGRDISVDDLRNCYHVVAFAHGADIEKTLGEIFHEGGYIFAPNYTSIP